ncbi:FlgD immunoglobulin-like domain containing protein [Streptomyces sp. NPDC126499]|uniref:FlgD immunoglobulin-like domain containing protein n=1 Tax=Streptomyces sp. NPDC126499 TaxID=3155314 RepID=UPI0033207627
MLRPARRRAFPRTALATAVVLAATSGLTGTLTLPAAAEDPAPAPAADEVVADEVVIPDPGRFMPRGEKIDHAGTTGYVHTQEGSSLRWRDLATGTDSPLPPKYLTADTARHSGHFAYYNRDTRQFTVTDLATGLATATLEVPAGQNWTRAFTADGLVSATKTADGAYDGLRLLRKTGGEVTEQVITGLREPVAKLYVLEQDMRGALLTTQKVAEGPYTSYLLDYATATLTPTTTVSLFADRSLGHDRLLVEQSNDAVLTVPRDNPSATPVVTPLPAKGVNEAAWSTSTVLGDWILVRHDLDPFWGKYSAGGKLYAVPLGGGTARELLPHGADKLTVTPDGSVLVVGGSSAQDWAVHRVTLGEDGAPQLTTVRKVPQMPATYRGIAVGGGRVHYLSDTNPGQTLYEVDTRTPTEARRRDWYPTDNMPAPKGPLSLGDGESAVAWSSSVQTPITENSGRSLYLSADATLLDAGGRYTLSTDGSTQYVGDFGDTQGSQILLKRPQGAAALWGTKLWKPATVTGKVNAYDLVTKATTPDIDLGSGCVPAELQALGRWLYWACAGGAKAGVYDQQGKKSVAVPAGEALLGDGYVVRRDNAAGKLLLTDAATGRTSEFADIPVRTAAGSGRRVDWAVDKFGGGVAFVDAQKNIHVKRVPIAPQALTVLHAFEMGKYASDPTWTHLWRLSRPAGAWKVTIRTAGGNVVRTLSGEGGEGASIRAVWDGKDDAGNGVLEGSYRYDLEAHEPGGTTTALRAGGTIQAYGTVLTTSPSSYQPLAPKRILDTRAGVGIRKAKLVPWQRFQLKVAGVGGVPATGVGSVVLNVTATNTTKPGHITVLPGTAGPYHSSNGTSQVNFTAGQTASNLVTVPVVDGKVEFFANTSGSTDLVADVSGYYTPGTGGSAFQPLTPTRFMDTRSGMGVPRAKIGQGGTARLQVTGVKGVPASGVTAVVMNVTATNATRSTYVTAYPDGTPRPGTSSLNVPAGRTVAGAVVVPVVNGKVAFTNGWGSVDLLGDVVGYYTGGEGAAFTGSEPRRLMDTRLGFGVRKGAVGPGQSVTLQVGGSGVIPEKVRAVVLNVTATQPTTAGYVTVHPAGTPRGTTSSLNFRAGQTVPNLVVVPVVDGKVTFSNHSGDVHLIADVEGWFL